MINAVCALALLQAPSVAPTDESAYYSVDYLRPPEGALVEVGGMDFLPDGRLALSTRRGQVWIVDNPLDPDPTKATFHLFAEGLQEGLGLKVVDGHIVVLQRGELSLLRDDDKDGRCDTIECVCNSWGVSGNYHEFAFGLPFDDNLNAYVSLNVGFWDPKWWHGKSKAPWRGWVIKITPNGEVRPFASGFRSPCGISMSPDQELWVTDNQGDWEPVGPVYQVKQGRFYGHPASLAWTDAYKKTNTEPSDTVPPDVTREAPALWLPYKWSRSAGNVAWDTSAGKFGPFGGQMLISELTNGLLLRASLERVRGEWQGASFLFRQKLGSVVRVAQASDGTLFCGMTNRGWGGLSPATGVARVRWTKNTPFEVRDVHLLQDGFTLTFTKEIGAPQGVAALGAQNLRVSRYHYDWWWEYGSPERGTEALEVTSVETSADRKQLTFHLKDLRAGEMIRCVLAGLVSADGEPLLHDEFNYTLNQLPEGPVSTTPIARLVPPPSGRETKDDGWLRLCYGDALARFESLGWKLSDVDLDLADPKKLVTWEGVSALVNDPSNASDFKSRESFGDGIASVKFLLADGSDAELWLQGRYAVRIAAPRNVAARRVLACGEILSAGDAPAREPKLDAWKGPGQWHELEVHFHAPRFDAQGKKTADARIERVLVDQIEVQGECALPSPSVGASSAEAPQGPLVLRAHGAIAIGGVRFKPTAIEVPSGDEWKPLYAEDLEGWTASGAATWKVDEDGVLVGAGARGHLWTQRDDYSDFELSGSFKLSEGGRAALWLRATPPTASASKPADTKEPSSAPSAPADAGESRPLGYASILNCSHPSPERTGSWLDLAPITTELVDADTFVRYRIVRATRRGRCAKAWIGVLFNDHLEPRATSFARTSAEQHHEGSVLSDAAPLDPRARSSAR